MAAGQVRAPIIIPLRPPHGAKSKIIDTDTKIDIISDSPDTDIYFTVNSNKPDPYHSFDKTTFKYTVPFTLPAGKRTVKAMAISKDGNRESNIVTKVFDIELVDNVLENVNKLQPDAYGFLDELKEQKKATGDGSQRGSFHKKEKSDAGTYAPRFMSSKYEQRRSTESAISRNLSGLNLEIEHKANGIMDQNPRKSAKMPSDIYQQSLRIQRETDFLKCAFCMAPRPEDPNAKFCNFCSQPIPPLPQSRLPPPENGQLGVCIQCRSTVPMNVANCLVCEAPIQIQNQPQATIKLRDRIICSVCGTANPVNIDSCVTCEAKLPETSKLLSMFQQHQQQSEKPPNKQIVAYDQMENRLKSCSNCFRQITNDSRFCDWCGTKMSQMYPAAKNGYSVCSVCMACNKCESFYCSQCGHSLTNPQKPTNAPATENGPHIWNSITVPIPNGILKPENLSVQQSSLYAKKPNLNDMATQTVGLFYPSTAQIKKNEEKEKLPVKTAWDGVQTLSVVSPGKGYWRKQIDHIVSHLKAHASNNPEFQSLIGEPRMGKLITTNIHEEEFEIGITLTFALKGYKDPYVRDKAEDYDKRYLSSLLKRTGSFDSFRSDDTLRSQETQMSRKTPTSSFRSRSNRKKYPSKKTPKSSKRDNELPKIDQELLKEIGKDGGGREDVIKQLFEEGANPKCKSKKGTPFIIVAVRNNHPDAVRTLSKMGADINEIDPETGNTPLHEAVCQGPTHEAVVDELLNLGANTNVKNLKSETAYEIAVRMGNKFAVRLISEKLGKKQMEKLVKPKQIDDDDDF